VRVMQAEEDEDDEEAEWLEAESEGEQEVPRHRGTIVLDDVSIDTER